MYIYKTTTDEHLETCNKRDQIKKEDEEENTLCREEGKVTVEKCL